MSSPDIFAKTGIFSDPSPPCGALPGLDKEGGFEKTSNAFPEIHRIKLLMIKSRIIIKKRPRFSSQPFVLFTSQKPVLTI